MMNKIVLSLLLGALALSVGSCGLADGEGSGAYSKKGMVTTNGLYMHQVKGKEAVAVLVEKEKGGFAAISPRLAAPISEDVKVKLVIEPKVVNDYATKNNLKLKPVETSDVVFIDADGKEHQGSYELTIPAGMATATVYAGIKELSDEKYPISDRWAFGVSIQDNDKNIPVLSSPHTSIVTFDRLLNTSALHWISSPSSIKIQMNEPIAKEVTEWTFQMHVFFSKLERSDCMVYSPNQTVSNIYGVPKGMEWYTRIAYKAGIQLKTGRDGDDTWTNKPLKDNEWMQITWTFRRTGLNRGVTTVYVNGEMQQSWETQDYMWAKGTKDAGWAIGGCPWGNDYIREIKMWNRVLTPAEMLEKLYLPEDPKDPDLLFYVPFSKKTITLSPFTVQELTGNAHVIIPEDFSASVQDNIIFPNTKMVIDEPKQENYQ